MTSVLEAIAGRNAAQQRRVVEKRQGETIEVAEGSAAGLLVTGCEGCTINAPGRLSSVTVERCGGGTRVNVGSVVASLEVIHCTDVEVSAARCRTITVDVSTNVCVSCECQAPGGDQLRGDEGAEEAKVHPGARAEEASAVRLFTSCSEGVSISFGGLLLLPLPASSPSDADGDGGENPPASAPAAAAATYRVPKDGRYEKGDGPRSVSRVTVDGTGECGTCKTLRCDQYGIPLEQAEAEKAGVPWTWEHGRA